ncbi:hypothetical protein PI124_g21135 [Phytophthora idaei]|nr:hypothetical protein PI125_g22722 [Phytophthora idaei]KAG3129675.1 hypothetical protein PI126_g20854 [Phytophthora idaei]KAG3233800.1 hypothetical protein PI124_g21135 [Phytophthora idaei]
MWKTGIPWTLELFAEEMCDTPENQEEIGYVKV